MCVNSHIVPYIYRKSSGFSRGASVYRGVTRFNLDITILKTYVYMQHVTWPWSCLCNLSRHHQHGRWQARIGRVAGNKDLYLGTFSMKQLLYMAWLNNIRYFIHTLFLYQIFVLFWRHARRSSRGVRYRGN